MLVYYPAACDVVKVVTLTTASCYAHSQFYGMFMVTVRTMQ